MTKDETLRIALEALESKYIVGCSSWRFQQDEAITAIKEALQSNEQIEPVAWRWPYKFKDIGETGAYEYHSHEFACLAHLPKGEPLYTHPPVPTAQPETTKHELLCVCGCTWEIDSQGNEELISMPPHRPLVGLTDDDREAAMDGMYNRWDIAEAIEAKLKEKNGIKE